MGTAGIDLAAGLTESEWEVVQVKKAMMKAADKMAMLTISEKLGSVKRMKFCEVAEVDYLITELSPDDEVLSQWRKNKIEVL